MSWAEPPHSILLPKGGEETLPQWSGTMETKRWSFRYRPFSPLGRGPASDSIQGTG